MRGYFKNPNIGCGMKIGKKLSMGGSSKYEEYHKSSRIKYPGRPGRNRGKKTFESKLGAYASSVFYRSRIYHNLRYITKQVKCKVDYREFEI
jgi:hypothetical protein